MMLVSTQTGAGAGIGILVLVVVIAGFYFIPSIVGKVRNVPNIGSVFVINFLLGWTLVGWAVALAMAVRSVGPSTQVVIHRTESVCGSCGSPLGVGAKFCAGCGTSRVTR
jgi:hypothetical protein